MKGSARLVGSILSLVVAFNAGALSTDSFFAISGGEWMEIFNSANPGCSSGIDFVCASNACCDSKMLKKLSDTMRMSLDNCEQQLEKREKSLSASHKFLEYKILGESIAFNWSKAFLQRKQWSANIHELMNTLELQDEFEKRLADPSDGLDDAMRYKGLMSLPGVAARLYWKAERLYWRGQYAKAMKVLELFVLPENKDGFSAGAAHFYIGRMFLYGQASPDEVPDEEAYKKSLEHLLLVPSYPTCLTYTSYSYIVPGP